MRILAMAAAGLTLLALPALAQAPQGAPINVRGTITKLSGQTLSVKQRDGKAMHVTLAPNTTVRTLVRKKLSDIHDGDYIASTSVRGKDGKLHALEVHFLPPAAPELQRPADLRAGSIMTNAHVAGTAKVKDGTDIALTYKGNTTDVVVAPKTPIVSFADGSMSDLKPGKAAFIFRATKAADGSISANSVTVEKNGIKPPM
jgi:hypothetical protein